MTELANIVIGIRLFNKEIGKGGIGLESFEDLVNHPSRELGNTVYTEVLNVVEECDDYSLVLG